MLGAFTVPLIAFFGAVYSASTGLPIGTSMFKSYAAIVNAPGVDVMSDVTEHKNVVSAVWINLCFFAGLLTFAVFLGLIVADIEDRLYEMRNSSAYPLYEQNHTLIFTGTGTRCRSSSPWTAMAMAAWGGASASRRWWSSPTRPRRRWIL